MTPPHAILSWSPDATGWLRVRIDDRIEPGLCRDVDVPAGIARDLAGPDGTGLTSDPAADLIRLESRLRLRAARRADTTATAQRAVDAARLDLHAIACWRGLAIKLERRRLAARLSAAADDLNTVAGALEEAHRRLRAVRQFVIALDVPDGLLAAARVGWQRDPTQPAFVSAYATEDVFLIADLHRATTSTAGEQTIAGDQFGVAWRRDGDDDDPHTDEPAVIGPWRLGYIPATGEVYASRRCHYLEPQVWLLGSGFVDPDSTRRLLSDLKQHHMREPNSLIHAAHTIHNASVHDTATHPAHPGVMDHGQADTQTDAQADAQDRAGSLRPPRGTGPVAADQPGWR